MVVVVVVVVAVAGLGLLGVFSTKGEGWKHGDYSTTFIRWKDVMYQPPAAVEVCADKEEWLSVASREYHGNVVGSPRQSPRQFVRWWDFECHQKFDPVIHWQHCIRARNDEGCRTWHAPIF